MSIFLVQDSRIFLTDLPHFNLDQNKCFFKNGVAEHFVEWKLLSLTLLSGV